MTAVTSILLRLKAARSLWNIGVEASRFDRVPMFHLNENAVPPRGWKAIRETDVIGKCAGYSIAHGHLHGLRSDVLLLGNRHCGHRGRAGWMNVREDCPIVLDESRVGQHAHIKSHVARRSALRI